MTLKREMENYIHPSAIKDSLGIDVTFGSMDDVPFLVAEKMHIAAPNAKPWAEVARNQRELNEKCSRAKRRLNAQAALFMNVSRLQEIDEAGEIISWFRKVKECFSSSD